jgi:acyl-CoA thioesterase FadM
MGLVHIPRVLGSVARGFWKRRGVEQAWKKGLSADNPHIYKGSVGLFDIDSFGHMNNASFLLHAEYARWEMTAYTGMIETMRRQGCIFLIASNVIRYRREIRPLFKKFAIDTHFAAMDEKNLWAVQNFRCEDNRVRAQVIVQGLLRQGNKTLSPIDFMKNVIGLDEQFINGMKRTESTTTQEILDRFADIEDSLRKAAAEDDSQQLSVGK